MCVAANSSHFRRNSPLNCSTKKLSLVIIMFSLFDVSACRVQLKEPFSRTQSSISANL